MPLMRLNPRPLRTFGLITLVLLSAAAPGQEVAPAPVSPTVFLRYRELTNREQFAFSLAGQKHSKPVGDMTMEFMEGTIPSAGLDPAVRTFCVEPLVPMYAGDVYPFAVDPLGQPAAFGLPNTPDGVAAGEKRARFIRELYGRFYEDVSADPKVNAPAFQVALWELSQETELPEGPMPFSLYTGAFRADYPAEADAPEFVQQAQRYVQSLTGDDSVFATNSTLAGQELTRLTALQPVGGALAGQSQLALRTTPSPAADSGGLGGPGVGNLGGLPSGIGGSPLRGAGGLGGPGIGSPVGGGGGVGGFGNPVVGTPTTVGGDTGTGPGGPATPSTNSVIPTIPNAPGSEIGTGAGGPSVQQTQFPPPPTTPPVVTPTTVPAPAGAVLAVVGLAVLGGRRLLARANRPLT